ncbi:sulfite oxidase [Ornithinibacillus caprae]|uniref:sulfite oxidase n=1 Tax=Ornithinibacillus caprae TaxID=2678566 RepID=UPI0012D92E7A|nr:sulfite oxidase [Ornithinibacillus caprae]
MITKSLSPENQETPIPFVQSDRVDKRLFFKRNHFSYPHLLSSSLYSLEIDGSVINPIKISLQHILKLPAKEVHTVLECAGNKRGFFRPKVFGEQWGKGAISQGVWRGISLKTLLQFTGLLDIEKEVVFIGNDYGKTTNSKQLHYFARSLPIEQALHEDTIIAYQYNGNPIPFKHGFPFRLIVPNWYAMASVKWVKRIEVIEKSFDGPFQCEDYIYYPNKENDAGAWPVTTKNVNSTIQKPLHMDELDTGKHIVKGIAWTGIGLITKVEISLNNGKSWNECELITTPKPYQWVQWEYEWNAAEKGEYTILSRATDSEGNKQPLIAYWNRKGYGYNAVDQIKIKID